MDTSEVNTITMKDKVLVPTSTTNSKKDMEEEIDLHSISEEDLKSLQKTDPFLYYSIPGVREAELSLEEVDHSEVLQAAHSVTRKTRISFEQHSSLVMEDIFDDEDEETESNDLTCIKDIDELLAKLVKVH